MEFHIQDPVFSLAFTLHEALVKASKDSVSAYGTYAFVTKSGVDLLLGDESFRKLIRTGGVRLIIGMDSITNEPTLDRLIQIKEEFHKLELKAFVHKNAGSLYHPKITIFSTKQGGVVINGSGNLTVGGLRKNREIFTVNSISLQELQKIKEYWTCWELENSENLFEIDSEVVREKAKQNAVESKKETEIKRRNLREGGKLEQAAGAADEKAEIEVLELIEEWSFTEEAEVLIAEIPKSSTRWKQANFDLKTYVDFFGGSTTTSAKSIIMRAVSEHEKLQEIEYRPCVASKSQNYRLELNAAAGMNYPEEGRPIAVFVKLSARTFLYFLCMPETEWYPEVQAWLATEWEGRADRMKRIVRSVDEISDLIEKTPLALYWFRARI